MNRTASASFSIKPSHRYVNPQAYDFEYSAPISQENKYSSISSTTDNVSRNTNNKNKKQTSTARMASSSIQVKEQSTGFSGPFSSTEGTTTQGSTQGISIKISETSFGDFY
jgi:hypothetical protein